MAKVKGSGCKVCGGTERYIKNGGCVACTLRRAKVSRTEPRAIAEVMGKTTYTGAVCSRCGGTLRYVSNGGCVACVRKRGNRT